MSFFSKFKKVLTSDIRTFFNVSITDEKAWDKSLLSLAGAQSISGENVTDKTALTYSAVWCAISLISGTISSLPLHLIHKKKGQKKILTDDSLYNLLHHNPNPYMSALQLRETIMLHLLTNGNAYCELQRNTYGNVFAIWPITPNRIIEIKLIDDKLFYVVSVNGDQVLLPKENILHVAGLGYDGFRGYSPIAMARKSIGLGMALETFGSRYFGNGTHPGVIVSHPQSLSAQAHENLKKSLVEKYSGLGNSHRLLILEEGLKMESISINPDDSQFLESRQFQIPEIARWFNLPPHKLKDLTKSSFNNIESEQISFVTDSILPWLVRLEQAYNAQILTEYQRKKNIYYRHNVEGLLRGNSKDRADYYRVMIGNGIMTPNEAREKEDMNPIDNELANELFMPTGLIPLNKFENYLSKHNSSENVETQTEKKIDDMNIIENNDNDDDIDNDKIKSISHEVRTIGIKKFRF